VSSSCAVTARAGSEELAGTAPVATGWMLVEQPGSWGPRALRESELDDEVAAALELAVAETPVRVQLVRRPGRRGHHGRPLVRTVVLAHTGTRPWAEVVELTDDAALAAIDPTVTLSARPPGIGLPVRLPLLLVCTHGRRDRCCATHGRPIVDALAALHQDQVWEVSHIGGHRFAGNLVVLPDGLVYGGLDVPRALRTVDLHLAGRLELSHARGRSGQDRAVQAAELALRREIGEDHLDALEALEHAPRREDGAMVGLRHVDGRRWRVEVAFEPTHRPRLLSCDAGEPQDPGRYRATSITRL
jgi:hypothetical protein